MLRPRNPVRVLVAAASTIWVYHFVSGVSGLVAMPLIVTRLGAVKYGIWVLVIQTISLMFSSSDLGTGNSLGRIVARARAGADQQALARIYSTAVAILAGSLVIVLGAALALAPLIPRILGVPAGYHSATSLAFVIMAASLALQFPLNIGYGILTGHQIYGVGGLFKTVGSVMGFLGVIALVGTHSVDLVPLALVFGTAPLLGQALTVVTAWRLTGPWSVSVRHVSWNTAREMVDLGGSTLITTLSRVLHRSAIAIALGRHLGAEAAGVYGIALTLVYHVMPLAMSVTGPFTTLASEWQARGEIPTAQTTINMGIRVTSVLATSAFALAFVYGEPAMLLLFSSRSWGVPELHQAASTLAIMLAGAAAGLPQYVTVRSLQGIGKHWQIARASLAMSAASVVVAVTLLLLGAGIYGAALGWSLFWVLHGFLVYPLFMSAVLRQPFAAMLYRCYLPGLTFGLGALFVASSAAIVLPPTNATRLVAGLAACASAAGLAVLLLDPHGARTFGAALRDRLHWGRGAAGSEKVQEEDGPQQLDGARDARNQVGEQLSPKKLKR